MKVAAIVGLIFLVLILGVAGLGVANYVSYSNSGNEFENQINTTYANNQNVLGQYSLKVKEVAHVSDKYKDALKDVVGKAISSRYGADGSKAMMQWITEQNPNLDPSIYIKIQQIIESGRNEFQVNQSTLLDQCRVYKTQLGYLWGGFWFRITGYPKEGLEKRCTIVQSEYSTEAFKTGIEKGVDF